MSYRGNSKFNRRADVAREAYTMAVDYLLRTEFAGVETAEELADLTGMSHHNAGLMLKRQNIMQQDLMEICEARGIDFAVTVRLPDGKEITFLPSQNFGVVDNRRRSRVAEEKKTKTA